MASRCGILALVGVVLLATTARADELAIVSGSTGLDLEVLRHQLDGFEQLTGNTVRIVARPSSSTDQFADYRLWLADENAGIDIFRTDITWAPRLADRLVDLSGPLAGGAGEHFPQFLRSQTVVAGKLLAMPLSADAPALFYRTDLLEKHGFKPPATWAELTETARAIMDKERAAGNAALWGYVFQGAPYAGLTCNALEWIASSGGGSIVEPDGSISIDNPHAAAALDLARSWIGAIAPPEVLSFTEEEARAVFQAGNAVFMRNWPYALALGNADDSPIRGRFAIAPLPAGEGGRSAATLGGWSLALSKGTRRRDAAIALIRYLAAPEAQKYRALHAANLPTRPALYNDPDIAAEQPAMVAWREIVATAVARPSAATGNRYDAVSKEFWTAVHDTLSGKGTAAENLAALKTRLERVKGSGW